MRAAVKRLAMAGLSGAMFFSLGCDDTRQADKLVKKAIAESETAAASSASPDAALTLLKQAANEANASPAAHAHAKALLAQTEVASAAKLINDAQAGNLEIARLIWDITFLGAQIQNSNTTIAAYKQFNPTAVQQFNALQVAAAQGAPDKPVWLDAPAGALPSLTAVKQEISKLQGAIAQKQEQIKQLNAQRTTVAADADKFNKSAATKKGKEGVVEFRKASDLRKQAADLQTKIDVVTAQIIPLQADLTIAQDRETAATKAIAEFQQLQQGVDSGWQQIQQQVAAQTAVATTVLSGAGAAATTQPSPVSITAKSARLSEVTKKSKEAYDAAVQTLTDAISHYKDAVEAAEGLQRGLQVRMSNDPSLTGTPLETAIKTEIESLHAINFRLAQANTTEMLASLHASRAVALNGRLKLVQSLDPVVKQAGLALPPTLNEADLTAAAATAVKAADEDFDQATQLFLVVSDSPIQSEDRKNAARVGRIFSLFGRAQLVRGSNDAKAKEYFADARSARDSAIQANAILPSLPSELVIPPPRPATAAAPTTGRAAPKALMPPKAVAPAPTPAAAITADKVAGAWIGPNINITFKSDGSYSQTNGDSGTWTLTGQNLEISHQIGPKAGTKDVYPVATLTAAQMVLAKIGAPPIILTRQAAAPTTPTPAARPPAPSQTGP